MNRSRAHRIARTSLALIGALAVACTSTAPSAPGALTLADVQLIGTHNSYKQFMDPALFAQLRENVGPAFDGLDYGHPPLAAQLDDGVRLLELDVFHDPLGGRYAAPTGLALLRAQGAAAAPFDPAPLMAPGFKVLHLQDLDFRSVCPTLLHCLGELRAWSERNPGHLPVMVTLNAKDAPIEAMDAVRPLPFDVEAWAALDAELVAGLGRERLIVPDAVRGDADTLRAAIMGRGWPRLDALRGRFLFVLDETGEKAAGYLRGHPSLAGRIMFVTAPRAHPAAAVLILNDPIAEGERIRAAVEAGFLVRTRADADTREARSGDTRRREAALASGAQFVSTDYPEPDPRFGTGYAVRMPDGALVRCNPVRRPRGCPPDAWTMRP